MIVNLEDAGVAPRLLKRGENLNGISFISPTTLTVVSFTIFQLASLPTPLAGDSHTPLPACTLAVSWDR